MAESAAKEDFDVVIVGGGGAGLAAAIEARAEGASVVLLEKNPQLGGSTAWAIGSISATGTPHQLKRGIADNPTDHWADMRLFAKPELADRDNEELRRILCDDVPDTFRWLLAAGVRFYGPMPEPPHRLPRMHNVLPNAGAYIYHLERRARRAGASIRLNQRATSLLVEQSRVTGVETSGPEGRMHFSAHRATILASGDFTSGAELKAQYISPQAAKIAGLNPTATGDGQVMALQLGARVVNGDLALGPQLRFIPPSRPSLLRRLPPWPALAATMQWALDHAPQAVLRPFIMSFLTTALAPSPTLFAMGAILVNNNGKRFCDETDNPALALADQPGQIAHIIIDKRIAQLFSAWPNFISTAPGVAYAYVADYRRNRPDVFTEAATLDRLARLLGMDPSALIGAASASDLSAAHGPFIALGPVRSNFIHSEGGLAVDHQHRVLGPSERPIAGLFAAGSTGQGGLLLDGHGHHLAWAFVSGRRAGRFAARAERGAARESIPASVPRR